MTPLEKKVSFFFPFGYLGRVTSANGGIGGVWSRSPAANGIVLGKGFIAKLPTIYVDSFTSSDPPVCPHMGLDCVFVSYTM